MRYRESARVLPRVIHVPWSRLSWNATERNRPEFKCERIGFLRACTLRQNSPVSSL